MTHLVLTFTHYDCSASPTGKTNFEIQVGDSQVCPKCGIFVEAKPMFYEGRSTELPIPITEINSHPIKGSRK